MKKILLFLFIAVYFLITRRIKNKKYKLNNKEEFDWSYLDKGIYWFGRNNKGEKFIKGKQNKYFDYNKPTVIYIHGWNNEVVKNNNRETFNPKADGIGMDLDVNCADLWIDKGWNIGIFYWTQFADEKSVKDVEAKIWTDNGSKNLRWKNSNLDYENYDGTEKSIAEIFVNEYISAMKDFKGEEIRIVGHSLGAQVSINAARLIENNISSGNISDKLRPDRIALLDPFWSKGNKSYLNNRTTGSVCCEIVRYLKLEGIIFETYKTSILNECWIGDSNLEMRKLTAFTKLSLDFISIFDQSARHCAAKDWYFYSFGFNPPVETINGVNTGKSAISASTSTKRLREEENSGYVWYQDKGKEEMSVAYDTYEKMKL